MRHKLFEFWQQRDSGEPVLLDRYSTNYASFAIAWIAHVFKVTPNQLSILSGVFSLCAFAVAVGSPITESFVPLLWIFIFAQVAYVLDCADGMLARITDQESKYGDFLDHGIDIGASALVFGAVFAFLYRHFSAITEEEIANFSLLIGFLFLLTRSARFFVWQKFMHVYQEQEKRGGKDFIPGHDILVSLMDHQMSLLGILFFLVTPFTGFIFFGAQTLLLGAAYVRYFLRAWRLENNFTIRED